MSPLEAACPRVRDLQSDHRLKVSKSSDQQKARGLQRLINWCQISLSDGFIGSGDTELIPDQSLSGILTGIL